MVRYFSSCYLWLEYITADMGGAGDNFVTQLQLRTFHSSFKRGKWTLAAHGLVPRFSGQQISGSRYSAKYGAKTGEQSRVGFVNYSSPNCGFTRAMYLLIEIGSFYWSLRHRLSYQRQLPVNQGINEMFCNKNINKNPSQYVLYM